MTIREKQYQHVGLFYMLLGRSTIVLLMLLSLSACSQKHTNDPKNKVVRLKNDIVELVDGAIPEVDGQTFDHEAFVFFDGYATEGDLASLEIDQHLRQELANISPRDERYVIAQINMGRITAYTYFEHGWPRDRMNQTIPSIIEPTPLLIRGSPFRLTKEPTLKSRVTLKLEK